MAESDNEGGVKDNEKPRLRLGHDPRPLKPGETVEESAGPGGLDIANLRPPSPEEQEALRLRAEARRAAKRAADLVPNEHLMRRISEEHREKMWREARAHERGEAELKETIRGNELANLNNALIHEVRMDVGRLVESAKASRKVGLWTLRAALISGILAALALAKAAW